MASPDGVEAKAALNGLKRARSADTELLSNEAKRTKIEEGPPVPLDEQAAKPAAKDKKKRKKKPKKRKSTVVSVSPPMLASGSSTRLEDMQVAPKDKGKGKAVAESPESALIIADLTRQLAAQTKVVEKHQNVLGQIQSTLTCKICLDLMFKPYVLAPCGHTSCYQCLVSWFTAPLSDAQANQHIPVIHRKKTCPHCRTSIAERPAECYDIKTAVNNLVQSALIPGLDAAPMPFVNPNAQAIVVPPANGVPDGGGPPDPWAGIFRKSRNSNYERVLDMMGNGWFGPPPPPAAGGGGGGGGNHDHPDAAMGIVDAEDGGIYRCIDCLHEIWDGACSECGRVYPGHDDDWSEGDGDDSEHGIDLMHDPGWMNGGAPLPHHNPFAWFGGHLHGDDDSDSDEDEDGESVGGVHAHIHVVGEDEDDSNDDDDELEGSFIDDDDVVPLPSHGGGSPIVISSDSEDDDDEAPQVRRSRRRPIVIDESDQSTDEKEAEDAPRKRAGAAALRRAQVVVIDSDEEDEDEEVQIVDPPAASSRKGKGKGRRVVIESDEDDDEEEEAASDPPKVKTAENEDEDESDGSDSGRTLAERIAAEEREMYGDDGSTSRVPKAFRQFADARRAAPSNNMEHMFADEDEEERSRDSDDGDEVGDEDESRNPWVMSGSDED